MPGEVCVCSPFGRVMVNSQYGIIGTTAGLLSIILQLLYNKLYLKMFSSKCQPFCQGRKATMLCSCPFIENKQTYKMPQGQNVIYFSKQGLSYCLGVLLDKLKLLDARTICV